MSSSSSSSSASSKMSSVDTSPSSGSSGVIDMVGRLESASALDRGFGPLDRASAAINSSGAGPVLRGEGVGHPVHPPLTDVPVGCWSAAIILDLIGGRSSRRASRRLIGIGILAALPTAASGLADAGGLTDERSRRVAVAHGIGNTIALLCFVRSWRHRGRGHSHLRSMSWSLLGGAAMAASGYLGGHLAFGRPVERPGSGAEMDAPGSDEGQSSAPTFAPPGAVAAMSVGD